MARTPTPKDIEALRHQNRRVNNPTAEMAPIYEQNEELMGVKWKAMKVERAFPLAAGETRARDGDLDPQIVWNGVRITLTQAQREQLQETGEVEIGDAQLVWRGKDREDWSDLVVNAPPLYIQEKVHPKAIIDDLQRRTAESRATADEAPDLFADFNGLKDPEDRYEFYRHSMHWQNRFILGDSLQVMASLAQREGLKGKVQAIYFDPPYGIKFNSNWQVSTLSRDVKDGKATDITREPEQVKAFRDTWKDGIHSYLTYLRDRLTVARELLTESGSIFVQIGDENVHRVRAVMDEVFGAENFVSEITLVKTSGQTAQYLSGVADFCLWFARKKDSLKYRPVYQQKTAGGVGAGSYLQVQTNTGERLRAGDGVEGRPFAYDNMTSQRPPGYFEVDFEGRRLNPAKRYWATGQTGISRLARSRRLGVTGNTLRFVRFLDDFPIFPVTNVWADTGTGSFTEDKTYVVQTGTKIIERCLLMATDPGDLVLDPTCGSGTTATVAEQWGRRWITIDTSRVALALARTRLMSARYPYYLLADSADGRAKEGQLTGRIRLARRQGRQIPRRARFGGGARSARPLVGGPDRAPAGDRCLDRPRCRCRTAL
jgi:adenine-specific DNA-methyltransferase